MADSKLDTTIEVAFLHGVTMSIEESLGGAGNGVDDAYAVVTAVMPAYQRCVDASVVAEEQAPATVTVTLVRWPFT